MDLNEIKKKAKDLIADLTDPRPEHDDRPPREPGDDPAARTDRLDAPVGTPIDERTDRTDPRGPEGPEGRTGVAAEDTRPAPGPAGSHGEPTATSGYPGELGVPPGVDPRDQLGSAGAHREGPVAPAAEPGAAAVAEYGDDGLRTGDPADGTPTTGYRAEPAPPSEFRGQPARADEIRADEIRADEIREQPARVPAADFRDERVDPAPTPALTDDHPGVTAGEQGRHHIRQDVAVGDTDAPERLVSAERAESYSSRWDEVKGGFVDEPRQAVAQADGLVGELLDELGQLFEHQRHSIEHGLDTDTTSTEDLRLALRRYRSFFDRLLSV